MRAIVASGARRLASLALLLLLVPAAAHGYAFLLVPESGGVPRRWDLGSFLDGRVPWMISTRVRADISGDRSIFDVVAGSFARWENVEVSGIRFAFEGETGLRGRNGEDAVNLVILGSNDSLGTGVLAATFLTNASDGRLTDVDIVVNRDVPFDTSIVPAPGTFDLEAVMTHEIGHLVGLEHSALLRATMAPFTDRGDVHQRTPETDDAIGAGLLYPEGGFPAGRGSLSGRVTLDGEGLFLSHVVATTVHGRVAASTYTTPDGTYRIDGLEPDVYVVHAERLDGPVLPRNVAGFRDGFGTAEATGYETSFH